MHEDFKVPKIVCGKETRPLRFLCNFAAKELSRKMAQKTQKKMTENMIVKVG